MSAKEEDVGSQYAVLPYRQYLTPGEVANFVGFRVETVRGWLRRGLLSGLRISGQWRIGRTAFISWLEGHRESTE